MAEFHLESLFLQGSGHMSKAQRRPNTEPHAPPEALDSRSIFWKGRPIFYNVQVSTMTDTHQRRYVFEVQRTHDWNTGAAEYPIPWHPRSFKSILWNGPAFFYNFEASTMAEAFQKGMFLKFNGQVLHHRHLGWSPLVFITWNTKCCQC